LDLTLTDNQLITQRAAREFALTEIAPIAAEHDESGTFPVETVRKAGQLGFMGVEVPIEYGGAGLDIFDSPRTARAFSRSAAGK
jgi:alkylation response protein AidB-like acyl-CoA dehydrogenase